MTKYVYATNSFNLIAELDGLNNDAVIRTYTWGKDLSGTLSGAGGVGGLLKSLIRDRLIIRLTIFFLESIFHLHS